MWIAVGLEPRFHHNTTDGVNEGDVESDSFGQPQSLPWGFTRPGTESPS